MSTSSLTSFVDELAGRVLCRGIHPHVERRVGGVREASFGPVELHARDAEVEQDRVSAQLVVGQALEDVGKVATKDLSTASAAPERLEVRPHARVPVDGDELAFALEIGHEQRRMAARAESGVDDRLPGCVEQPPHFFARTGT